MGGGGTNTTAPKNCEWAYEARREKFSWRCGTHVDVREHHAEKICEELQSKKTAHCRL
jgi:hypothetical protein